MVGGPVADSHHSIVPLSPEAVFLDRATQEVGEAALRAVMCHRARQAAQGGTARVVETIVLQHQAAPADRLRMAAGAAAVSTMVPVIPAKLPGAAVVAQLREVFTRGRFTIRTTGMCMTHGEDHGHG